MNETTTNNKLDISVSDNFHIFGIPFVIHESVHTTMLINKDDVRDWIDKVEFLQNAGLEFCFNYKKE